MAKTINFSILVAILLSALIASPIFAQEEISPSRYDSFADSPAEEYDEELLEELPRNHLEFIKNCTEKMTTKCGEEIFDHMLEDTKISKQCCKNMLEMGEECHLALIKVIFSTYEYKDTGLIGVPRSKEVWNKCVVDVGSEIGAPVSFET